MADEMQFGTAEGGLVAMPSLDERRRRPAVIYLPLSPGAGQVEAKVRADARSELIKTGGQVAGR